ncbi:hypothetical protein EV424DRAFT_1536997 [Suillus variegatus]|nr:hypothetical protein EV424DRAFT_1536997 [Suillus variegatus]
MNDLQVFVHDGQVYTSLTAHSLPNIIPYEPLWDPRDDSDSSPDDSDTPLTTRWAYAARPWFPLIPLNPSFDGPIFGCLNHSRFSLLTEVDQQGKYLLHRDIRGKWHDLEQKLLWCQECLGAGLLVPWGTKLPRPPTAYGYQRSHADANLAKKVAMRSRNAFLLIATTCSWHIMSRRYRGSNHAWMSILTNDLKYPIPAEWVLELSRSFVGDLTTNVPRTGALISSVHCPWQVQLPIFEKFSIPIWVRFPQNASASAVDFSLHHYIPSQGAITRATEAVQLDQPDDVIWGQPDDVAWGQPDDVTWGQQDDNSQTTLGWNGSVLGWGQDGGDQPMSDAPEAHADLDSLFPIPKPHSGQKRGEAWKAFFARRRDENKKKEETETPAQRQSRQSRERAAMNHSIPGRSSTVIVFEWQPDDEFDGFRQRVRLTKAELPMTWMSYNKSTRVYDSFRNEWDLCDALDPTSIPDGDWEEDNFPSTPPSEPSNPTPAPPLPPLSSFLQDIDTYFGGYEVAPSAQYTSGVERFVSVLHFHLGYQLAASTTKPRGRSTTFDDWTRKTKWAHLCKLVGDDSENITSIPDAQKHVITCFIGYLVTISQSQLSEIPPDLWDLGPDPSLSVSNAHIRVSYVQHSNQRLYIIEPRLLSSSLVPWKLAVTEAITAVMCLRRDWGPEITKIALHLLEKGIAIKTLLPMSVASHARRPLTELRTYTLGHVLPPKDHRLPHFRPVYADYIMYEQHRHEFMNQPRARAALLHGGLIWRLALHSLGFEVLPSVLDGISREAVPFGLMLSIDGQTYFDDELSEEEGVSRERNKITDDANGLMTSTQWKGSLKFNPGTNKMMKNVDAACCSFLATVTSNIGHMAPLSFSLHPRLHLSPARPPLPLIR